MNSVCWLPVFSFLESSLQDRDFSIIFSLFVFPGFLSLSPLQMMGQPHPMQCNQPWRRTNLPSWRERERRRSRNWSRGWSVWREWKEKEEPVTPVFLFSGRWIHDMHGRKIKRERERMEADYFSASVLPNFLLLLLLSSSLSYSVGLLFFYPSSLSSVVGTWIGVFQRGIRDSKEAPVSIFFCPSSLTHFNLFYVSGSKFMH